MVGDIRIRTQSGALLQMDWYFMLHVVVDGAAVALLLGLRKLYYHVEYTITALNVSSARNVVALHDAFYGQEVEPGSALIDDEDAIVLQRIDQHVSGIRGRRRGVLNFPFWLVEHVFSTLYGLRPTFSVMSREERRYFLRTTLLCQPSERARAFIPAAADVVYQLGNAVHAFITLGHYSSRKGGAEVGYILPDARDRLQGDDAAAPPPFYAPAPLPQGPQDPANFKPAPKPEEKPRVAPRVTTPTGGQAVPDAVDYVIIGSGAGGATMAYRLACEVGDPSRILLVERGPRYLPLQDFNDDEMEMIRKLYKEGGLQQSRRFDLIILQGECLGGTTVINNAVCFKMPASVRDLWQQTYGLSLEGMETAYGKVAEELEIDDIDDRGINTRVKDKFIQGIHAFNAAHQAEALIAADILKANQRDIMGSGLCNLGNKRLRKRTMLETYIPWAEGLGVQVVDGTSAVRYMANHGNTRAESVLLRSPIGIFKRVNVRKAVIVAGGAISSSHFLMRSGVSGPVGRRLSCNFAFPVAFDFADELDAFDGVQITLGALDRDNRAVFETYFNPPGALALSLPFYFRRHRDAMARYRHLVNFGALVGSEPNGTIARKADPINGRPFSWELGLQDRAHIKYALSTLLEIGQQAGAQRAYLPTEPGLAMALQPDDLARFSAALADYPLQMRDLRLTTAHPQGGNSMIGTAAAQRSARVVDEHFRVEGMANVFVADASVFPTSIGVNPQWTIMALSTLAAQQVLQLAP